MKTERGKKRMSYSGKNWSFIGDFGWNDREDICKILKLLSKDKYILFKYYKFKIDDFPLELQLDIIENDFNDFCSESFNYNNPDNRIRTESKVKQMLYEEFRDILDYKLPKKDKQNVLFNKLCNGELDAVNSKIISEIKLLISKSISEEHIPAKERFIKQRQIFKNSTDVSYRKFNETIGNPEFVWYCPTNDGEINEIIKDGITFECIITQNLEVFEEYIWAIEVFEQIDFIMAIENRKEGDIKSLATRIKNLTHNKYYVIDEEELCNK